MKGYTRIPDRGLPQDKNRKVRYKEIIFLEQWHHEIIRQKVKEDTEYRKFSGKESITRVTRADIDRYQLFKLTKTLSYVYEKSAYYHALFDNNGIKAGNIRSLDNIARIPFTEPADIAGQPYAFACVSLADIARATTFTSSGTIGPQKRVFFTDRDLEIMTDFMATGMRTVAGEGDVVQIMLPSSSRPNDQADLLAKGVRKMGGIPVVSGATTTPEEQLRIIDESHPAVLFTPLPIIYRITRETEHLHDLKAKKVKTLFVTAEYIPAPVRKRLESAWGCEVHVHYGLTEMGLGVAVECHAHNGCHYNEADLLVEVIDPDTGTVLENDREGELVFTTLSREAMPLIRYRTHDISRLIGRTCECGASTLKKIGDVPRRRESTVKISSGDEIYPTIFDDLIFSFEEVIDYQLTLTKEGDRDTILFKIEVIRESENTLKAISKAVSGCPLIKRNLESLRMNHPRFELVDQGTLKRLNRAKKLIIDNR